MFLSWISCTFAVQNIKNMLHQEIQHYIDSQFHYYLDNQDEIVKMYNGKVVVIKDNSVVDAYDDRKQAYFESVKKYGLGNFLLQRCSPGNEAYTRYSHKMIFA